MHTTSNIAFIVAKKLTQGVKCHLFQLSFIHLCHLSLYCYFRDFIFVVYTYIIYTHIVCAYTQIHLLLLLLLLLSYHRRLRMILRSARTARGRRSG